MSLSASAGLQVEEHVATVDNTSDSGAVTVRSTHDDPDRSIHAVLVGEHVSVGKTLSVEYTGTLGEPSGADAGAITTSTGNGQVIKGSTILYNVGLGQQNDTTNQLGFATGQSFYIQFPAPFTWNSQESLATHFWNGANTTDPQDMRVLYYYTE